MKLYKYIGFLFTLLFLFGDFAHAETDIHRKKRKRKSKQKQSTVQVKVPMITPAFPFEMVSDSTHPIHQIFKADTSFYAPYLIYHKQRRIQVIYTKIDRDKNQFPSFTTYHFDPGASQYFYPASCVKLPLCALTLEKINSLAIPGLNINTPLEVDSVYSCQYTTVWDSTAVLNGYKASLGNYIKKILLVSDNDAYNRLFEFNGTKHIHGRLSQIGLPNVRITHRFAMCDNNSNRVTNRFRFLDPCGETFYIQDSIRDDNVYSQIPANYKIGNAYMDLYNKMIYTPKDFTDRNYFKLIDIDGVLKRLLFPETFDSTQRFKLTFLDYNLIRKYMSMYATESNEPKYDTAHKYFDAIKKYFIFGMNRDTVVDKSIRIFNIVGFSYGFLVDCAYIFDTVTHTEFMLSAVIYSNPSEILNWNKYEYFTIGMPFLKKLGLDFLQYEKNRPKKTIPNLKPFIFDYSNYRE